MALSVDTIALLADAMPLLVETMALSADAIASAYSRTKT